MSRPDRNTSSTNGTGGSSGGVSEERVRVIVRQFAQQARSEACAEACAEAKRETTRQIDALDFRNTLKSMMSTVALQGAIREEVKTQAGEVVPILVRHSVNAIVRERVDAECRDAVPRTLAKHLCNSLTVTRAAEEMSAEFRIIQQQKLREMMRDHAHVLLGPFTTEMRNKCESEIERMKGRHAEAMKDVEAKYASKISEAHNVALLSTMLATVSLAVQFVSKL